MREAQGFTLIELSIVLVIIGLVVGGILVGRHMVESAQERAQIAQIQKYHQAVNTFKGKYGALPGDMAVSTAAQNGFITANCTGGTGHRDGNGFLDGANFGCGTGNGQCTGQFQGETGLFWVDLSTAGLIDFQAPNSGAPAPVCGPTDFGAPVLNTTPGTTFIGDYLPQAKIGAGAFVFAYQYAGYNWFGVEIILNSKANGSGYLNDNPQPPTVQPIAPMPAIMAYDIDKKIDDGLPNSGSVTAQIDYEYLVGLQALGNYADHPGGAEPLCWNDATNSYAIDALNNYGRGGNCALAFRFQ